VSGRTKTIVATSSEGGECFDLAMRLRKLPTSPITGRRVMAWVMRAPR